MSDNRASPPEATPTPTTSNNGGTNEQAEPRGGGDSNNSRNGRNNRNSNRGRTSRGGSGTRPTTPAFKGNTTDMNGHVFQCYAESNNKQQFQDTVTALAEYINKNLKHPKDVVTLCQTGNQIKPIAIPKDLTAEEKESETKQRIWKARCDTYVAREDTQAANMQAIYSVIWGQCSPSMQAKLRSLSEFEAKEEEWDCVWLLKNVKAITHMFEGTRSRYLAIDDALSNYENCKQGPHENVHDYMKRFQTCVEVIEHYGASIGHHRTLIEGETDIGMDKPSADEAAEEHERYRELQTKVAKNKSVAMAFLKRADRQRFGALWRDLMNLYARGQDQYPSDLTNAYNLLVNFKTSKPRTGGGGDNTGPASGMSFLQQEDENGMVPGTDGVVYEDVECFRCGKKGHYRGQCPQPEGRRGVTCLQVHQDTETDEVEEDTSSWPEFSFAQCGIDVIPPHWVLLDSQSTVSIFKTKHFVKNIRNSRFPLRVRTNGGIQVSTQIADVKNFGEVWYNPRSLANILSMAAVRKVCRITMDTDIEPALCVHRKDGTTMKFKEYKTGLYYFDANAAQPTLTPPSANSTTSTTVDPYTSDYLFINTVADNKRMYTQREVERANDARTLFKQIDCPSYPRFEYFLRNNLIRNCPVTVDDVRRALHIYGPDPAALKGKTVQKGSQHVTSFAEVRPLAPILHLHQNITFCVDILYINGNSFITTISRAICFRTIAPITNRSKTTLLREIRTVKAFYEERGFTVVDVHADQEFACIQHELGATRVNIANADDHVPEVERSIRTIKERVRASIHGMPYRRLPKLMIRAIADKAVRSLNQFPAQQGISNTMSPLTIMTGRANLDYNMLRLEFGSYAQVFEANDPTNTTQARMTGAIVLNQTDNEQGGYYFMSLNTGRRLSRLQWQELPIPNEVIARVETMAENEGQRLMGNGLPLFEWAPGHEVEDEVDASMPHDIFDLPEEQDERNDIDDGNAGDAEDGNAGDAEDVMGEAPDVEDAGSIADGDAPDDPPTTQEPETEADELSTNTDDEDHEEVNETDTVDPVEPEAQPEVREFDGNEEIPTSRYRLRPNRGRNYDHRLDHQMDEPESQQSYNGTQFAQYTLGAPEHAMFDTEAELRQFITGFIMTQMTADAGIKKHGQRAIEALFQEFSQLDTKTVFEAVLASTLTDEQKREALNAINLIKEKRSGTLKGRTCADGRKQRTLYEKAETASPTVSSDALMMSYLIDADEDRDVGCADVTGAYLNADMDVYTLLKLTGQAVEIMCQVNSEYEKFVTIEKGRKVLYLRLRKALYGCVRSALLWYELFANTLKDMGFTLNPYDPCVANKIIDGHQCTIAWYVDDNKVSHKDPDVVSAVIAKIEEKFGKMTVTRGKKHTFLGTDIEYKGDGTVALKMRPYLEEAIEDFGERITRKPKTPAARGLLDIDEESPSLGEGKAQVFHSIVAKLLYVSKRARLDIQLPVAFLCTRVSRCTEQDWEKLRRVLEYVADTLDFELILGADDLSVMNTWVDVSYAAHSDMKSHTGAGVSFGRGTLMSKSTKQKINTKSSTEAELVGASDYLPNSIWLQRFLAAQGYELKASIFHQDNQSAIKLEKNGRVSAGQRSRHIDIRYFFIKDRIERENITLQYCPTESMLADFFTKPLQGKLFQKLRSVVLGHTHTSELWTMEPLPQTNQERVGENGQTEGSVIPKDEFDRSAGKTEQKSATNDKMEKNTERARSYAEIAKIGAKSSLSQNNPILGRV